MEKNNQLINNIIDLMKGLDNKQLKIIYSFIKAMQE